MSVKIFFRSSKGNKLCGILSNPSGDKSQPIIVMCHGFSTSKGGRTYVSLEDVLNRKGISTFRFDFFGHGESEGTFEEITLSEAADDVKCAIRYVKNWGYEHVGLVGSSFGGLASIITAAQSKDIFLLALKSPVSDYMGLLIAREQELDIKTWEKEGFIFVKGADGQRLKLNYAFFGDTERMEGYTYARKINVPTLIVHGSQDETVPLSQSRKTASLVPDCRLEIIEGADHVYSNPQHFQEMLNLITEFIIGAKD